MEYIPQTLEKRALGSQVGCTEAWQYRAFSFDMSYCCKFGLSRSTCAGTCLCQSCAVVLVQLLHLSRRLVPPCRYRSIKVCGSTYTPIRTIMSFSFISVNLSGMNSNSFSPWMLSYSAALFSFTAAGYNVVNLSCCLILQLT